MGWSECRNGILIWMYYIFSSNEYSIWMGANNVSIYPSTLLRKFFLNISCWCVYVIYRGTKHHFLKKKLRVNYGIATVHEEIQPRTRNIGRVSITWVMLGMWLCVRNVSHRTTRPLTFRQCCYALARRTTRHSSLKYSFWQCGYACARRTTGHSSFKYSLDNRNHKWNQSLFRNIKKHTLNKWARVTIVGYASYQWLWDDIDIDDVDDVNDADDVDNDHGE